MSLSLAPEVYERREFHGMSRTPEYRVWVGMRARCYHPKTRGYDRYGGRGIQVCKQWKISFTAFIQDVGPRPDKGYDLARKDPNKGYEPGNCEWQRHEVNMKHLRPRTKR